MTQKKESKKDQRATEDDPTDGRVAQQHREKMQRQEKAEGDRRD
jgi:hypothetical protein